MTTQTKLAERSPVDLLALANFTPRQQQATSWLLKRRKKYLLYGGAAGGGKSRWLRWVAVLYLIYVAGRFGLRNVAVMLACEDYPSLKDRQISKIEVEFPAWLGTMHQDHAVWGRCFILAPRFGGGIICFRNLDDPAKYRSAEFAAILVDELTLNDLETFNLLRMRLRWPGIPDRDCPFIAATNPTGKGAGWVKSYWVDRKLPAEFHRHIDPEDPDSPLISSLFQFVPARADDNPHLDPSYYASLDSQPEYLRKAYREGSWEIFEGQAFQEWNREVHILRPPYPVIPRWARIYMSFDWGFGKPFSLGWWWAEKDSGRLFHFREWYGWNGTPDQGIRLADSAITEGILEREREWGLEGREIIRLAGPDCFAQRPDYRGGGRGPTTAEVFAEVGRRNGRELVLQCWDDSRRPGKRQMHERLRVREDGLPGLLVYDCCEQFIRTVPSLVLAKHNPEDVDTDGEDHPYDMARGVLMARPMSYAPVPAKVTREARVYVDFDPQLRDGSIFENRDQEEDDWKNL